MLAGLAACAPRLDAPEISDPYEAQNRQMHALNAAIQRDFIAPLKGDGGGAGLSPELTQPIVNFADNVAGPGMVLNGLLQGNIGSAATNAVRFLLNTTVGVGGLFDPADAIGLTEVETDFAQTLAVWGVPEGAYLELPLIGPSTERDVAGKIVDFLIDPLDRFGTPPQRVWGTGAKLAARAIKLDQYGDTINEVLTESADSYAQQRLVYIQNRRYELGTTPETESFDPYDSLYGEVE